MRLKALALLLSTIAAVITSTAQPYGPTTVRYVLVQLSSETNRLKAMAAAHNEKGLAEVKNDAEKIIKATIKDFKDHFQYCPVYFYMDTNAALIQEGKYEGIVYDTGLRQVMPEMPADKNGYLLVYFGSPATQPSDTADHAAMAGIPYGKGLVICDPHFHQVDYIYTLKPSTEVLQRKQMKGYFHFSKHYNIEYFPLAGRFSRRLDRKD